MDKLGNALTAYMAAEARRSSDTGGSRQEARPKSGSETPKKTSELVQPASAVTQPAPPRKPIVGILIDGNPVQSVPQAEEADEASSRLPGGSVLQLNAAGTVKPVRPAARYVDAIEEFGGVAKLIWDDGRTPGESLTGLHGLLIPGGKDIHPKFYGQTEDPSSGLNPAPENFDRFEIAVTQEALKKGIPIRGICRGHQVLNVAAGGKLIQDIATHLHRIPPYNRLNHRTGMHGITLLPGSRLHEILGEETLRVGSVHHQAVGMVAPGFVPVAVAADNIIEAIEKGDNPAVLGVQFHPERGGNNTFVRSRFFRSFVEDAREYRDRIDPPPFQAIRSTIYEGTRADPEKAIQKLLDRGYRFNTKDGFFFGLKNPQKILETAQKTKMHVEMPEARSHSTTWVISTYPLFVETVLVEAEIARASPDNQRILDLIEANKGLGIKFHPKKSPGNELRSRMSMLFYFLNNELLASRPGGGAPIPATWEDLELWSEGEEKAQGPAPKAPSDEAKKPYEIEYERLHAGLDALDKEGFELKCQNQRMTPETLRNSLWYGREFSVHRKKNGKEILRCSEARMKELLHSLTDEREKLSPKTQEILRLVSSLRQAGGKFYTKGFLRNKPITFEIQVAWLLKEGPASRIWVEHPKNAYGEEEVKSLGQLRNILSLYREEWKPQGG